MLSFDRLSRTGAERREGRRKQASKEEESGLFFRPGVGEKNSQRPAFFPWEERQDFEAREPKDALLFEIRARCCP